MPKFQKISKVKKKKLQTYFHFKTQGNDNFKVFVIFTANKPEIVISLWLVCQRKNLNSVTTKHVTKINKLNQIAQDWHSLQQPLSASTPI